MDLLTVVVALGAAAIGQVPADRRAHRPGGGRTRRRREEGGRTAVLVTRDDARPASGGVQVRRAEDPCDRFR
ncbi:hypothetical protein [Streptomyces sp. NPDC014622]|uniref:hypothetical protein n=2 Tax=unclassified Streptomyces TaxID=2593676 RepID=UPI0036F947CE